jgi:hypothetical protein
MTDASTETTDIGEQHLIAGVKPVTVRDKLQRLADVPLAPRTPQSPATSTFLTRLRASNSRCSDAAVRFTLS